MKKKILSLMLMTSLVAGMFAGCGEKEVAESTSKTESQPAKESSVAAPASSEAEEEDGSVTFPLEEPITLNILAKARNEVSADYANMEYWKRVEEATGIKVNWTVAKADEFTQKLNLALVSGEYPDVIIGGSGAAVTKADEEVYGVQQEVFLPLDDYLNESYMPNLMSAVAEVPDVLDQQRATDGHIYSLCNYGDMGVTTAGHMFINKVWLDNLGLEIPTTIEELENVLRAFKNDDPNGNGQADEVPYSSLLFSDTQGVNLLAGCFGQLDTSNHLVIEGDKVVFSATSDAYRTAVEWISKIYQEGLLDPEAFSHDAMTYYSKLKGGNVGFFIDWRLTSMALSYPGMENDYVCIDPVAASGVEKAVWLRTESAANTGSLVITTANQYVEETIAWADYLYEPYFSLSAIVGPIDLMSHIDEDGRIATDTNEDGTAKYTNEEINAAAPGHGSLSFLTPSIYAKVYNFHPGHLEKFPYCAQYEPYLCEIAPARIGYGRLGGDDLDRASVLQTDIDKYVKETMVEFFSHGVTDDSWENYKKTLNEIGLEEYVALKQKSYDLYLSTAK